MKKKQIKKSGKWFIKVRGSYLPHSWQGWLTFVPFTAFLVTVMTMAMRTEDTYSGMFYVIFPQWIAAAVVMTWIAQKKS